jgi:hypothetical protein
MGLASFLAICLVILTPTPHPRRDSKPGDRDRARSAEWGKGHFCGDRNFFSAPMIYEEKSKVAITQKSIPLIKKV